MTNDEIEALEKRLRAVGTTFYKQMADAIAQLRAEVERLTRERDEAVALNSVNESCANNALDLLESMKTLCEAHMARAQAAERERDIEEAR